MKRDELLNALTALDRPSGEPFKSQTDCINWSNKVVPLLAFNRSQQEEFLRCAQIVNIPSLSADTYGAAVNQMMSILKQSIGQLQSGKVLQEHSQTQSAWYSRPLGMLLLGILGSLIAAWICWAVAKFYN